MNDKHSQLKTDALAFHAAGRPGKLEVTATKPLTTQRDLSLAYSPGVAHPCLEIEANPEAANEINERRPSYLSASRAKAA